ncbi:histidinol-phosphate aminotransferase [Flexibacter flexilis DSM 6793]|uniref:Histidinol-phosphate aminotransferase n=1 Tax=Flexibacter flexilis DSM 6793 TaxID=927664 RepID=A0A1I1DUC8_9BACT|nr:histidinol-phosphate transaminase [Flexibacter flexilis]SFB76310.1 histidinol-phosphate aminotransferase [Flexibacter flexilis DSM 6793]
MKPFTELLQPHILALAPYSSARDEYTGSEGVFLDANENPLGSVGSSQNYNRYPDPYQHAIKTELARIKGVNPNQIFLGNGSDEAIDLLIRAFCKPSHDQILIMPPTYGMYEVSANINNVGIVRVPLTADYQIDVAAVQAAITPQTKILFICSPNNPTGNALNPQHIQTLLDTFEGIVILDEAYIDFCPETSWLSKLDSYPNLVIIQTFSKAWGLAGLRVGMAFAQAGPIAVLNKIKPPYNISLVTQQIVLESLLHESEKDAMVAEILHQRVSLAAALETFSFVQKIHVSDANFLLVQMLNAKQIFDYLIDNQVIVRNRANVILCSDCLRISVGTQAENEVLLQKLAMWEKKSM